MRYISLSDDGLRLAPNAYHRLLVTCFFPESPRDQEQGLLIAAMEKEEFDRVGQDNFQPSEISGAVMRLVENRTAQIYLAGLVSFILTWLALKEQRPSVNRASIIASCAANEFGRIEWASSFDPSGSIRNKAATSDVATLQKIFRQYRSVAHITAARVALSEYLAPLHIWDQAPLAVNSLICISAAMQRLLSNITDVSGWNLWDVQQSFPKELEDFPLFQPGDNLFTWIQIGYDQALEQGLIKRER